MKYMYAILILIIFTGCSKTLIQGLSPQGANSQAVVMIAQTDIVCDHTLAKKGTVFSVKDMSNIEYHVPTTSALVTILDLITGVNAYNFKDNVLLLEWSNEEYHSSILGGSGFLVYPNGKFAYEDNYITVFNKAANIWWILEDECSYDGEFPFVIQDNR